MLRHDRRILEALAPRARVAVAPNVIDVDAYILWPPPKVHHAYTGSMDWLPNRERRRLLCLLHPSPSARSAAKRRIRVVGRAALAGISPSARVDSGVVFTGAVENIQDRTVKRQSASFLSGSAAAPAQDPRGGRDGEAVVSTTIAPGLTLRPGSEILIEDDPALFAARSSAAFRPRPAHRPRISGTRHVKDHYSFGALQRHVDAALREFFGPQIPRCAPGLSAEVMR